MHANRTILVVDDEPEIVETYRHYLGASERRLTIHSARVRPAAPRAGLGYRILSAKDGAEALALIERELANGSPVTAGFFDMKMPGSLDGLSTIKRARELDPRILCTVVTAYHDHVLDGIVDVFSDGREDELQYLNKPFSPQEIQQKARAMVVSWNRRRTDELFLDLFAKSSAHVHDGATSEEFNAVILDMVTRVTECRRVSLWSWTIHWQLDACSEEMCPTPPVSDALNSEPVLETENRVELRLPALGARSLMVLEGLPTGGIPSSTLQRLGQSVGPLLQNRRLLDALKHSNAVLEDRVKERTASLALRTDALEEANRQLQSTEKRLVAAERLALIGEMSASIAHEINTPSAYILSNLDYTLERLRAGSFPRDPDIEEALSEGRDGVLRIARIVDDLRAFARVNPNEDETANVSRCIEHTLRLMNNEVSHRAQVQVTGERALYVRCAATRLTQVLTNLLTNALQAFVSTRIEDNRVTFDVASEAGEGVLRVRDTGPGVPAEARSRIFEPFFTTKERIGTGLGLSVCKRLVEAYGGTIELEESSPEGTTFTIRLPRAEAVMEPETRDPTPAPTGQRILVIDDEHYVLRGFQRYFEPRSEVVSCADADSAIELLARDRHFDLVLCDLMMPGRSGAEVVDWIEAERPELLDVTLIMTGGAFTDDGFELAERHRDRIIKKPLDLRVVQERLAAARH